MRKLIIWITLFNVILLAQFTNLSYSQRSSTVSVKKLWESAELLTTSESVCYEPIENVLYVSCINGNPTEKDENGFIAKLSLSGEIIVLNWFTGLNAPKGMGIHEKRLYVTDIDRIVEIDMISSKIIKEYPVDGARFLNDITIDSKGAIYISDMATNKIHRLHKGVMETWLENENVVSPNGLFYENGEILIGTKNGIFSTNIESMRTWQIVKNVGGIDGLKADSRHNYIISDWMGKIQLVHPDKETVILINTTDEGINAADFEFIPAKNILYVPTFSRNSVSAYEISQ